MAHRNEHIIVFQHANFRGHHRHIFGVENNLNHPEDTTLNDKISSFVVLNGTWQLFKHANFVEPYPGTFGPGQYEFVGNFGVQNDQVSSLRAV